MPEAQSNQSHKIVLQALNPPPSSSPPPPVVSLPPVAFRDSIVPIGREFFLKKKHLAGAPILCSEDDEDEDIDDERIIIPSNINPDNLDQFTYYEILGLSSFGDSADRSLIRKAYHKAVLLYHPDKMHSKGHSEEECRAIFLKVQAASDTLSDPAKRRAYDSLLDFDDSIPTEEEAKEAEKAGVEAFLELFEPVFKRNARFALQKPVPGIGSANTPIAHVNNFYSYWVKFDSWRDFTNVDREHDPDQAESREHKRWMQKENEKNAKKLKKKEMARLNELVTRALAHDPRVIEEKERVKNEKAAHKAEQQRRLDQERLEKEEQEKKAEMEKARIAKEEKLRNEKARKQAGKARNIFRKQLRSIAESGKGTMEGEFGIMSNEDCELICQTTETALLDEFNEKLSLLQPNAQTDVLEHLAHLKKQREEKIAEEKKQIELRRKEHEKNALSSSLKKKGVNREWTSEELSVLSKGVKRFPAGTRQRWVTICNYMNELLKPDTPFEKEECLQASQNAMKIMATLQEAASSAQKTTTSSNTASPSSPLTATPPPPPPSSSNQTSAKAKEGEASKEAPAAWTQEEQKLLENALKKYPASMEKNARWIAIANDIPGKSKKDCILRFKKLREELQAAKAKK